MGKLVKIGALIGILALAICMTAPTIYQVGAKTGWATYRSPDGWSVSYPSDMVRGAEENGALSLYDNEKVMVITPYDATDYPFDMMVLAFRLTLDDMGTILNESDVFNTVQGYKGKIIVATNEELGFMMAVIIGGDEHTFVTLATFMNLSTMTENEISAESSEIGEILATLKD